MNKKTIVIAISASAVFLLSSAFLFFLGFGGAADEGEKSPRGNPAYFTFEGGFITNVKDSRKYLKTGITIKVDCEKNKKELENNMFKIKDAVIRVLRNKTEADLIAPDAQEALKADIKAVLCDELSFNGIEELYFDEFIMQ